MRGEDRKTGENRRKDCGTWKDVWLPGQLEVCESSLSHLDNRGAWQAHPICWSNCTA